MRSVAEGSAGDSGAKATVDDDGYLHGLPEEGARLGSGGA